MTGRFEGRAAIVTGAGSSGPGVGIGRATAVVLARQGAQVVLVDRSADALDETLALVSAAEGRGKGVVGDVGDEDTCARAVAAAAGTGRLDILVNNVGVFGPGGGLEGVEPAAWAAALRTNVTSMALMAKHAMPLIAAVGGGAVVNLSSVAALAGTGTEWLLYSTSKGAVVALTRQLASRCGPLGIRVNCVAPGMVDTPMVAGRGTEADRERRRLAAPLRTEGTAWEIADVIAFLCSDEARWVSGVVLPVDGGLMAALPSTEGPWPDELVPIPQRDHEEET